MHITPTPLPLGLPANTTQAATQVLPQVQAQAVAPITTQAVSRASRSETGQKSRTKKEKAAGENTSDDGKVLHALDIKV